MRALMQPRLSKVQQYQLRYFVRTELHSCSESGNVQWKYFNEKFFVTTTDNFIILKIN